jgi:tetratricopeptide (TPR) repeat protein
LLLGAIMMWSVAFAAPSEPAVAPAKAPVRVSLHGDGLCRAGLIQGSSAPALGVPALRAALDAYRRDLGADDPSTLRCAVSLAELLVMASKPEPALQLLDEVLSQLVKLRGAAHHDALFVANHRAAALAALKRYDEAIAQMRDVATSWARIRGVLQPKTLALIAAQAAPAISVSGKPIDTLTARTTLLTQQRQITTWSQERLRRGHPQSLISMSFEAALASELDDKERSHVADLTAILEGIFTALESNTPEPVGSFTGQDVRIFTEPNYDAIATLLHAVYGAEAWNGRPTNFNALPERAYLAITKHYPVPHPQALLALYRHTSFQSVVKQPKGAQALLEAALPVIVAKLGADHPDAIYSRSMLTSALLEQKRYAQALPLLDANVTLLRGSANRYGLDTLPSPPNAFNAGVISGKAAYVREQTSPVGKVFTQRLVELAELPANTTADEHEALAAAVRLTYSYQQAKQTDKANALREGLLRIVDETRGEDDQSAWNLRRIFFTQYVAEGNFARAIELASKNLAIAHRVHGNGAAATTGYKRSLADLYQRQGNDEKALSMYVELADVARKNYGEKSPETVQAFAAVAASYRRLKQLDLALQWEESSVEAARASQGPTHRNTLIAEKALAKSYLELGMTEKANALQADMEKRAREKASSAIEGK